MDKRAEDLKSKKRNIEKIITGEAGNRAEEGPEKENGKKDQMCEVFNTMRRISKCFLSFSHRRFDI